MPRNSLLDEFACQKQDELKRKMVDLFYQRMATSDEEIIHEMRGLLDDILKEKIDALIKR